MKKITLLLTLLFAGQSYSQYALEQLITYPGSSSGNPKNFIEFNDLIYFNATSGPLSSNAELWRTDGTSTGTLQGADINPGLGGSNPENFIEFNGYLYFTAGVFGVSGTELYRTNGTVTELFKEFRPGPDEGLNSSNTFVILNSKLYFFARDNEDGYDLWRTDGTLVGTEKMVDLNSNNAFPKENFLELNGELFFLMDDPFENTIGHELYKYNENTNAISVVKNILPNTDNSQHITYLTKFDDKLFFSAFSNDANKLFVSDGTSDGTFNIQNTIPIVSNNPKKLQVFNNELFFVATESGFGSDLYKCFKNIENNYVIEKVYDFNPTGNINLTPFSNVINDGNNIFTEFNNDLYFAAREQSAANNGQNFQIYKTNGITTEIAFELDETVAGPNQDIYHIMVFNGKLFFMMKGLGMPQKQLWVADPITNTATRITDYYGSNDQPNYVLENFSPFIYNNNFYFRANSINEGYELWKLSDGNLETENFKANSISAFPNPSTGIVNIKMDDRVSDFTIEIFDTIGKKWATFNNKTQIDISNLVAGIYLFKITDLQNYTTHTHKIIKQ